MARKPEPLSVLQIPAVREANARGDMKVSVSRPKRAAKKKTAKKKRG